MNLKEVCIQYLEELIIKLRKDDAEMIDVSVDRETRELFLEGLIQKPIPTGVCTLKIRYKTGVK
jgi:hypothetical protein